jgi:hypothetical protein
VERRQLAAPQVSRWTVRLTRSLVVERQRIRATLYLGSLCIRFLYRLMSFDTSVMISEAASMI